MLSSAASALFLRDVFNLTVKYLKKKKRRKPLQSAVYLVAIVMWFCVLKYAVLRAGLMNHSNRRVTKEMIKLVLQALLNLSGKKLSK